MSWIFLLFVLMAGCGGNDNNDTILTGFSGVLIFGIVIWIIYRVVKKNTGD